MIGIITPLEEQRVAEEFFQLFKTPWEVYVPGRSYDVVIVTNGQVSAIQASLILVFGSEFTEADRLTGAGNPSHSHSGSLNTPEGLLPIYGNLVSFQGCSENAICTTDDSKPAGFAFKGSRAKVLRIGYDLFKEVAFLLSNGQPVENAMTPALEIHIALLRRWILDARIPLLEIPPIPSGRDFVVCLTHDIDFIGIQRHKFDHTLLGFLYRSTIGGVREFVRGRISIQRLLRMWKALASLPFVYLGWARDFWSPFEWYLKVEKGLSPTYFFIPFKDRMGRKVQARHASRRASTYDVTDVSDWLPKLTNEGCEIGVHGIDAWHDAAKGRDELQRVASTAGISGLGIRMHWLLADQCTPEVLEQAGYLYDSTAGYNDTVGYRSGTTQVFRPLRVQKLLELPLHIQDGALFFAEKLNLSEAEAWEKCESIINVAKKHGGILTVLWHDRSHGPERFWGEFYASLVVRLKSCNVWFANARQAVAWFDKRRAVVFERIGEDGSGVRLRSRDGEEPAGPPFRLRFYRYDQENDVPRMEDLDWDGNRELEFSGLNAGEPYGSEHTMSATKGAVEVIAAGL